MNTQIKSIKNSTDSEIAHLESEKDNAIRAIPNADQAAPVKGEYDEKVAVLYTKMRIAMLALRRQYEVKLHKLDDTVRNLENTYKANREETAKLIPSGQTNLYSRSYETLGDPSGNPIPIIAEPKALQATAPSAKDKADSK